MNKNIISLFIIGIVIYSQVLFAPFQLDDHELLINNEKLHSVLSVNFNERKYFTFLTLALNWMISKNPFGFHVVNIILHLFATAIAYLIIKRLDKKIALFVAFVFMIHPIQTESVTYIWQRSEVVAGLVYLLSYLSYLKGRMDKNYWYFILTIIFFLLGMKEKGTIITIPLMILLTERVYFKNIFNKIVSFIALISIPALAVFLIAPQFIGLRADAHIFVSKFAGFNLSGVNFATQSISVFQYIKLCFLPIAQNVEHNVIPVNSIYDVSILPFIIFTACLLLFGLFIYRKNKNITFGIFWFLIYLIPSSIIDREIMFEHRLYISIIGFGFILASIIPHKIRKELMVIIICLLSIMTINRNRLWCSSTLLLEDAVSKSPRKIRPHNMLGAEYLRQNRINDAERLFIETIIINPNSSEPYNNLGIIYARRGNYNLAKRMFEMSLKINELPAARKNLDELKKLR